MGVFGKWFPSLTGITDEQAMWRVQMHGDHEAFAELITRWEEPIRRLGVRMLGDAYGAEDLAQEAFARVFAGRHTYQQGRKFSTWLWRIALNLCHDEARRIRRRGERPFEETDSAEDAWPECPPGPDEQLIEQERAEFVRAALLSLPETHRAVVVMREYEGLKLREIAEILDIPEGTVKSRVADALAQLEQRLKPILNDRASAPACSTGRKRERQAL